MSATEPPIKGMDTLYTLCEEDTSPKTLFDFKVSFVYRGSTIGGVPIRSILAQSKTTLIGHLALYKFKKSKRVNFYIVVFRKPKQCTQRILLTVWTHIVVARP